MNLCLACNRPMRAVHAKVADHPGTVARQNSESCQSCYKRAKRLGTKLPGGREPRTDYRLEELDFLAGTDHPVRIAHRLGWTTWEACARWLDRNAPDELIDRITAGYAPYSRQEARRRLTT